jgi:hypothetical protein
MDLELYVLMAEHDNAGLPIAYLFLSTATSIEPLKRTRALKSFLDIIKNNYHTYPEFIHTDKDLAEVHASRDIWPSAKSQLCHWHVNRAVSDRIKKRKLATTPYNATRANNLFPFIDTSFVPRVRADPLDHEGSFEYDAPESTQENVERLLEYQRTGPNAISIRIPARNVEGLPSTSQSVRRLAPPTPEPPEESSDEERVFCPEQQRKPLLLMMEHHSNAHPLIPGEHAPTPDGVFHWAVNQAYSFCSSRGLPELWAYMWESWYRPGRWELWARAPYEKIPILRTTMIAESQYAHLLQSLNTYSRALTAGNS